MERDYISGRLLPSSVVCDVLAGLHDGLGLPVTHLAAIHWEQLRAQVVVPRLGFRHPPGGRHDGLLPAPAADVDEGALLRQAEFLELLGHGGEGQAW